MDNSKQTKGATKRKKKSDAIVTSSAPRAPIVNQPQGIIITTAEAGADDLEDKVNALTARLDKEVDKRHSEQRNIFIGVLLAVVLIVASVAVEVIIFNASFSDNLDKYNQQEDQDYRSLRDAIDNNQQSTTQQLLQLKSSNL